MAQIARLEMKRAVQLPRRKLPLTCLGPLVGLLGAFTTLNFREPVFAQRAPTDERERIAYLRSLAVLSEFEGDIYRAVEHLHEARALAEKIGLPGELWQIQCKIGELHERCRKTEEARRRVLPSGANLENARGEYRGREAKGGLSLGSTGASRARA